MDCRISQISEANQTHILVEGEFTISHARTVINAMQQSLERLTPETLDLESIESIDVFAIQMVYSWNQRVSAGGRAVKIINPTHQSVLDLLQNTGITKIF